MAKNPNTVNRGWLKRRIEAGEIEAQCNYRHTDDYAWDAATDFGKTTWMPARVRLKDELYRNSPSGFIHFCESDFRGYGNAWKEKCGTITLFFGYTSFSLRLKQKVEAQPLEEIAQAA